MTTLDAKANASNQTSKTESAATPAVEQKADSAALITEQQVLFASAPALAPAPAYHRRIAHGFVVALRAVFTRPEERRPPRHYPQRFSYLESSAMSREMDRL
jgi:hypothetical protein